MASIDCRDCQRKLYDLKTGQPVTYIVGPNDELGYEDGPDHKPQCRTGEGCPKGSPEEAHRHELSRRNRQKLATYRAVKVLGMGVVDPFVVDQTFADTMAVIDQFMTTRERNKQTDAMVDLFLLASRGANR